MKTTQSSSQFVLPQNISPLDTQLLLDGALSRAAFPALFLYLANEGLITIHETAGGYTLRSTLKPEFPTTDANAMMARMVSGEAYVLRRLGFDLRSSKPWPMPAPATAETIEAAKKDHTVPKRTALLDQTATLMDIGFEHRNLSGSSKRIQAAQQQLKQVQDMEIPLFLISFAVGITLGCIMASDNNASTLETIGLALVIGITSGSLTGALPHWLRLKYKLELKKALIALPTTHAKHVITELRRLKENIKHAVQTNQPVNTGTTIRILPYALVLGQHDDWLDLAARHNTFPKLPKWFHPLNPHPSTDRQRVKRLKKFITYVTAAAVQPGEVAISSQSDADKEIKQARDELDSATDALTDSII